KLYTAVKKSRDWQQIRELPFNSDEYSCGHPTLTVNDQVLYFVSDMPGGYGGTDIYLTRFADGEWSKPVNLGGLVNSQGSEMFPYVDDCGNLYFSTDGHPGLGGLDMFFV
ncbi:MAG: flagellar motor protein MotB, partial [Spirosomataceae bacterium]